MSRPYDLTQIKALAGGDQEFVKQMVIAFVEELPEDIKGMNDAISNDNATLTYQFAHKMKPNLKMFGLELDTEVKLLESWSKAEIERDHAVRHAKRITDKVRETVKALMIDFDL